MKKFLCLLGFAASLFATQCAGQQYQWLKGGGSTVPYSGSTPNEIREDVRYIATDDRKNVYVAAQVFDTAIVADQFSAVNRLPSMHKLLLARYDCEGSLKWAKVLECDGSVYTYGLKTYKGSVYLAGTFSGHSYGTNVWFGTNRFIGNTALTGTDSQRNFLARFDSLGSLSWIRFAGNKTQGDFMLFLLSQTGAFNIDSKGVLHHFAYLRLGANIQSAVVNQTGNYDIRYDTAGNMLSYIRLAVDTMFSFGRARVSPTNVEISSSGKLYAVLDRTIVTSALQLMAPVGYMLCAFSPTGALLWKDTTGKSVLGGTTNLRQTYYDGANGLYTVGNSAFGNFRFGTSNFSNTLTANGDISAVIKTDTNGVTKWISHTESVIGLGACCMQQLRIAPLGAGRIAAAGGATATIRNGKAIQKMGSGGNPYLLILDTSGRFLRFELLNQTSPQYDNYYTAMCPDSLGNLYLGGQVYDTVKPTNSLWYKRKGSFSDFYITKYGYGCNCVLPTASFSKSGSGPVQFNFTGTTPADSVVWDFGDGSYSTQVNPLHHFKKEGIYKVCVMVYATCGVTKYCQDANVLASSNGISAAFGSDALRIYPNPAQQAIRIETKYSGRLAIFNSLGQLCMDMNIEAGAQELDLRSLNSGTYLLRLNTQEGKSTQQVLVKQ
jgi:PKD repeat protein